jgi:hypothetical protein
MIGSTKKHQAQTRCLEVTTDADDNIFSGVRRCCPSGLAGDRQSEAFPEILEETKVITPREFLLAGRAAFNE